MMIQIVCTNPAAALAAALPMIHGSNCSYMVGTFTQREKF